MAGFWESFSRNISSFRKSSESSRRWGSQRSRVEKKYGSLDNLFTRSRVLMARRKARVSKRVKTPTRGGKEYGRGWGP